MITTPAEYIANLYRIQDANTPNKAQYLNCFVKQIRLDSK